MHSVYPRSIRPDTIIHGYYGDVNLDQLLKRINNHFGQTNHHGKNLGGL